MLKQLPGQKLIKDEYDEQMRRVLKSTALNSLIAATQILTVICIIKGIRYGKKVLRFWLLVGQPNCLISMIYLQLIIEMIPARFLKIVLPLLKTPDSVFTQYLIGQYDPVLRF